MTIQKYDWVSKDTKLNANGWSDPLSSGVFNSAQSSLNYSLNYLINFNTASVFIQHSAQSLYNSHFKVLI